jgi:acetolactate synthase-1/2/3 large subunit
MVKLAETMRNEEEVKKGYIATTLTERRYEKIAEVFGGYGEYVEDINEVIPAIRRALRSGKPSIINVRVADGRRTSRIIRCLPSEAK